MTDTPKRPPIVTSLVEIPELMAPDYAILKLRNGIVLLIGDSGINVFQSEAEVEAGTPSDGVIFP